jgi:DNA topoisomerase-1
VASIGSSRTCQEDLGVDAKNNFLSHGVMPGKEKVVEHQSAAKRPDSVCSNGPRSRRWTIGWHIAEVVKSGRGRARKPIYRILFNEIAKSAIQEAFKNRAR